MLVLSRKPGEKLFIDDPVTGRRITITVVKFTGAGVRIGVDAPRDMTILREEVQDLKLLRPAAAETA